MVESIGEEREESLLYAMCRVEKDKEAMGGDTRGGQEKPFLPK
jgi:hypothetical protein